ncbi:hypothetical protein FEM48_ZijujUnG0115500 [Ziziphus jujuba var. spinosa]|uniref:Amidase domain-containing protein n=1 Tax=Ziziphus jujuba var. spinosa TaxID=714518 RepID=A0A978U7Y7_ZIZJJ|nr:hypothetical protein FEM48_ZijujUnG0115500 [Ziziphus jujuba var. spinosa]
MRKKRLMAPLEEVDLPAVKYEDEEFQGNPLSILYGIFVAIKDDIDCYPHRTTGATTWMHGLCFVMENAVCVSRLHRCGVIFVGKANTH